MTKEQNLPPRPEIPSFWRGQDQDTIYSHLGENPFGPTKRVQDAILQAAQNANRYPDTNALLLRQKLAQYVGHGVSPENIIVGNGSDDLIDLSVLSFATPDKAVLTFEPSFFVYSFCSKRHGISVWHIRRTETFDLPQPDDLNMSQTPICQGAMPTSQSSVGMSLSQAPVCLTFIANPNNPTGTLTSREHLFRIIDSLPGIIVIDECYYEFCGETVADAIHDYKNLIVLRSLSKSFGLSGLRLGYAIAHENLIDIMASNALTFPANAIAQAAGIAAIDDIANYQKRVQEIIHSRNQMAETLADMGLNVLPSHTNFLLTIWPKEYPAGVPCPHREAGWACLALSKKGIYVSDQTKNLNQNRPALRIGIGTKNDNDRIIQEIRQVLKV